MPSFALLALAISAFATALGVIGLLGVLFLEPQQKQHESNLRGELAVFRNPQVWLGGLAVGVISIGLEERVSSGTAGKPSEARQNDRKIVPVAN